MKCSYITIERQYGSAGSEIARRLAEETGIPCYGREILEEVSEKYDLSIDQIEKYEETVRNSFLYSVYVMGQVQSGEGDYLAREGHIYVAEQTVIQEFASRGPGIFVGHCAAEALRNRSGVVNVFIRCSDDEVRNRRIEKDYGIPADEAENTRKWFDKKRANYYYANTQKKWTDMNNYDIVLDSCKLGIDGCVEALKGLIR